jgi:hypothetical protein
MPDGWWNELPENPYGPDFGQMALYCRTPEIVEDIIEKGREMGYDDWVTDIARHRGEILDTDHQQFVIKPIVIDAFMAFNYDLIQGVEFELMSWRHVHDSPLHQHYFEQNGYVPVMTYRVECVFTEQDRLFREFGMRPCYRFTTVSHENPNVFGRARYRDTMYDTYDELGYNLRCCARIPHEPYFVVPRGSGVELNPHYWGHEISDSELIDGIWYRHGWEPK